MRNPDMIAGGVYTSVADPSIPLQGRIGGLSENSSMGSQCGAADRSGWQTTPSNNKGMDAPRRRSFLTFVSIGEDEGE